MPINLPRDRMGAAIDALRPGSAQTLTVDGTSRASTAFVSQTVLRAVATQDCWIVVGTNPTAVASTGTLLTGGWPERVVVGKGEKIAVLRAGADGVLNLTELG